MKSGWIFWVLVAVCIAVAVIGVANDSESGKVFSFPFEGTDDSADGASDSGNTGDESAGGETVTGELAEPASGFRTRYFQLDEQAKLVYEQLLEAVSNGGLSATVKGSSIRDMYGTVTDAVHALYFDYPEFFWLNGRWDIEYSKFGFLGNSDITVNLYCYDYWNYVTDPNSYIEPVLAEAKRIASLAAACSDTYGRVKFVHDYLALNVVYDMSVYDEISNTQPAVSTQQSHTVYGCLVSKLAVCDGFAKSFQLIMNYLGIDCEYIEGDAGGGHAWNYLNIDGESYWIDVTWDNNDELKEDGTLKYGDEAQYDYFCITSEQLFRSHYPWDDLEYPLCDSNDYNYYRREGLYLETYDEELYKSMMQAQRADGQLVMDVQFGSPYEMNRAADKVYRGLLRDVPGFEDLSMFYRRNDSSYVLAVSFYN